MYIFFSETKDQRKQIFIHKRNPSGNTKASAGEDKIPPKLAKLANKYLVTS